MVKLDHDYDREVSGKFAMSSLECLADLILSEYRADERLVEYKIITKEAYIPSHPTLFVVDFSSRSLRAQKHFEIGETICFLEAHSKGSDTYTTFQCGPKDRIELRSDLAYVAHSCEPNIAFDLSSRDRSKWHVRAMQDIELGSPLTFFYPSTEWNLAKPFDCRCGARTCLGRVEGAKSLHREALMRRPHVNPWILFDEQANL